MADIHRTCFSATGKQAYDPQDRPLKILNECHEQINGILGEADKYNYIRAKVLTQIGKTHIAKAEREKAESVLLDAQT